MGRSWGPARKYNRIHRKTLECDGAEYEYRVKAYNDAGSSDYSNTDDATTLDYWSTHTLDSTNKVGEYTSIAIDSNDKVHISYYYCGVIEKGACSDADLKYATNSSGEWKYYAVDSAASVGTWSSIALDSNDNVHISYCDSTNQHLKYATNKDKLWSSSTLDPTVSAGIFTSIAIDSNDNVHISYYDSTNNRLKYTTNSSGSWEYYMFNSAGYYTSLALDSADYLHISYYDTSNFDLKYATNSSGSWIYYTLDSAGTVGQYTSIAVDSNDRVHISYYYYYDGYSGGALKYATNILGWWESYTLDSTGDVGMYTSIALDSNDKVHISYLDCISKLPKFCADTNLKYVTNSSGSWEYYTLDSAEDVGQHTSIAIDSNDKVHISYWDAANEDLKYATNAEVE